MLEASGKEVEEKDKRNLGMDIECEIFMFYDIKHQNLLL